MQNSIDRKKRLAPLGDLPEYQVKQGNPDIRGWEAYGADSLRLGEVRELIIDTDQMKALYMLVAFDRTLPNVQGDRCVMVPIGRARLDSALNRVYLDDATFGTAHTLPEFDPSALAEPDANRPAGRPKEPA